MSLLLLLGCVAQSFLASEYATLTTEINQAHLNQACAPRDLALADANYAFAKVEFQQGDTQRAAEHVALARHHVKAALACAPVAPAPVAAPVLVDSDTDGVADSLDTCPQVAEDLDGFRDVDGCPDPDDDGDGLADGQDACRDAAEDMNGFQDADGCPDGTGDRDGDGLADARDGCPDKPGAAADRGCPPADGDGDGLTDRMDACPAEAETKNGYLDEDGCPDAPPSRVQVTATQIVIKERIEFATGKATILPSSFPVLDDVATVLRDSPNLRVEIAGHTDAVGDDLANQRLSKARAEAVYEFLFNRGIAGYRMVTVGYGESRPVDSNDTEEGRQRNRRVEFVILSQ